MNKKEEIPVSTKKGNISIPERLKDFNKNQFFAVLATVEGGTQPYTSLISFAFTEDMRNVIFATPRDTSKYKNILNSGRVALLIDNRSKRRGELMMTEAITIIGDAKGVKRGKDWEKLATCFLKKHPDLEAFVRSPSTALVKVAVNTCLHVGQFQTVSIMDSREA